MNENTMKVKHLALLVAQVYEARLDEPRQWNRVMEQVRALLLYGGVTPAQKKSGSYPTLDEVQKWQPGLYPVLDYDLFNDLMRELPSKVARAVAVDVAMWMADTTEELDKEESK